MGDVIIRTDRPRVRYPISDPHNITSASQGRVFPGLGLPNRNYGFRPEASHDARMGRKSLILRYRPIGVALTVMCGGKSSTGGIS